MATKKTGISPDLLIHPGETIADVLADKDITQAELAVLAGVTPAYINQVINGKRNISTKFAFALEYALGISKSFWLNLQANYEAEKMEYEKEHTITEGEIQAFRQIKDVVKYLRSINRMRVGERLEEAVISAREALHVSNLGALETLAVGGSFRMPADARIDPFVMGAWLRICQLQGNKKKLAARFEKAKIAELVDGIKRIMCNRQTDFRDELEGLMAQHGIDFSLVRNFRGAPVNGYITQKKDGSYQMVMTLRGSFADVFWFSVFHEVGHIYHGHIGASFKFIDYGRDFEKEKEADDFAANALLAEDAYQDFLQKADFELPSIRAFAQDQGVMPCIVIGRLQKQGLLQYNAFSKEKIRYKWAAQ